MTLRQAAEAMEPVRDPTLGLMRTITSAQMRAGEEWIRERDISLEQGFILRYLTDNPGAIQRDIAREVQRGEANVSALLRRLEARDLVERRSEDGDARSKRVYATPAGTTLINGLNTAMAAVDENILTSLTHSERRMLTRLLGKITAKLPEHPRW
jgi:MarR family transcriptional repressor of mepA